MQKDKQDWLMQLRRCRNLETLEKVMEHTRNGLSEAELLAFDSAADHRLAEITMGQFFDKVPAAVWKHVR
ncbi:Haemolysin expression modulating protein [Kosakonia sacchari]|nr:Haemolysin expression modulating protein [Kosakonia sacchari]